MPMISNSHNISFLHIHLHVGGFIPTSVRFLTVRTRLGVQNKTFLFKTIIITVSPMYIRTIKNILCSKMSGFVNNSRIKHIHIAPALHVTVRQSFQATVGSSHSYGFLLPGQTLIKKRIEHFGRDFLRCYDCLFSTFLPPHTSCKIRPSVTIDPPLPRWTPGAPA